MKLIVVTGWVMSWLWKWIAASSIAKIMKSCNYNVTMMKLDPYLQIDAWTMSPFEHWETFVTKDWFETDLDLWHYERFLNEDLTKKSSVTTWQIYLSVIQKEREWKFLWKTVQVIPHITDEIKNKIKDISKWNDITIIEIWWTVWDIEWPHFLEAIRQLRQQYWKQNVCIVHVVPILQITTSWEMKTKAIQHSIIRLREIWLQADILICRTSKKIDLNMKKKLSLFCDLPVENIIEWLDQPSIYLVPKMFEEQWISKILQKQLFKNKTKKSNLKLWNQKVDKLLNPKNKIKIWIAGKYTNLDDAYLSVIEALKHAWIVFDAWIEIERINTEDYEDVNWDKKFKKLITDKNIKWIVVPGWFWNRGVEWKINIATFCRKNKIPYLGLCLWLQVATISFARNECNLEDANSTEFDNTTSNPVVDIMQSQKKIKKKWWTMRLWHYEALIKKNTLVYDLYKKYWKEFISQKEKNWDFIVLERHRHRFEVNPNYHKHLQNKWLIFSWMSPNWKLVEFIEYNSDKQFFVATQAHPELQSRLERPHPLFIWLIENILK